MDVDREALAKVICKLVNNPETGHILLRHFGGSGIWTPRLKQEDVYLFLDGRQPTESINQQDIIAALRFLCALGKAACPFVGG